MVPDFRRDNVWTPAFAGVTICETFFGIVNFFSREKPAENFGKTFKE
jgi:hypothetical protein